MWVPKFWNMLNTALNSARRLTALSRITCQTSQGILRLSAPPSISDSLLSPLVGAFQASYPKVRVQIFVSERFVDHIAEGIDLAFRVGDLKDSSLVPRKTSDVSASARSKPFLFGKVQASQDTTGFAQASAFLISASGQPREKLEVWTRQRKGHRNTQLSAASLMNDYAGLATALLAGAGIGDLPPIVQPQLIREGRLVEVMPRWHFGNLDLWMVHLGNRYVPRQVRVFKEFATPNGADTLPGAPDLICRLSNSQRSRPLHLEERCNPWHTRKVDARTSSNSAAHTSGQDRGNNTGTTWRGTHPTCPRAPFRSPFIRPPRVRLQMRPC